MPDHILLSWGWKPTLNSRHQTGWLYDKRWAMPTHYEYLGVSPYASSQEIETALAQQHQLGCIPEPMLTVIAATLLSVQQRQAYDQQLMALDEVPIPAQAPSLSQAQPEQSYHHANTDDDIVFYDDLHTSSQTQQLHQASQSEQMANNALTDAIGTVLDIISVGF